jgi:ABC-type lipoprotein export system ATPase subunit
MISTSGLKYSYNIHTKFEFPDILIEEKETLLVLGKSGVGKTTLLHLLGGLMKPKSGDILIGGESIKAKSEAQLDKFRGKNIGIVFQQNHFIESLSVLENVIIAQTLVGEKADKARALTLLERLGLKGKENKRTNEISHGEKQRVAIARAIINKPKLILADEPSSALDDDNCKEMVKLLQEQAALEHSSLIIVTHDGRLKDIVKNQIILNQ